MTESSLHSNITFPGTRNTGLTSLDVIPYIYGLSYDTIGEILRLTPAYKSIYDPDIVPEEYHDAYYDGEWMEYYDVPDVKLIRGSLLQPDVATLATNKGLVGTVLTAFNTHQNLQFRPDDIWISILAQFSAYVNGRGEELRSKIVDFEGQKALEVVSPGDIYSANYGAMNLAFMEKIAANIKDPTLKDWFLPGYTTTTETDNICAAAMAMCSFQQYFSYQFALICGIPQVTLLGTVDDWRLLRQKVERLVEFDGPDKLMSEQWVPVLREILDNFVESAKNGSENNLDFWNQVVSNTGGSCGGPEFLTGWISAFSAFNDKGELYADMGSGDWPVIRLNDIYHNVASCPATIDDNGRKYNATLFVGQMAYDFVVDEAFTNNNLPEAVGAIDTLDGNMRILKPRNDWALAISEGVVEAPAKDPEADELGPPDGTFIFGDECYLEPYNHSQGSFYDPLIPPLSTPSLPPVDSSLEDGPPNEDVASSSDDGLTANASDVVSSQNSGLSSSQTALIASMAIIGALIVLGGFFFMRKSKGRSAPAQNRTLPPKNINEPSKLAACRDESVSHTMMEESYRQTDEQPKSIGASDSLGSAAEIKT